MKLGIFKKLVPIFLKKWKNKRKIKKYIAERKKKPIVEKQQIINGLLEIGLKKGVIILVHSSLSHLGPVKGGAKTVIEALLEVIGEEGTLLMPAYPIKGTMHEYIQSGKIFDPKNSPSYMGVITDVFRCYPEVIRSLHPTHSVCGMGPKAEYLLKDHEKSSTPCGKNSPFYKLIENDGYILHLGSRFGQTTSFHVVEDIVRDFPVKTYLNKTFPMRFLDLEGNEHTLEIKVHNPKNIVGRIDNNSKKEKEIYSYCVKNGIVKTGKIGNAINYLISAKKLENLLEELAKKGITIYGNK